MILTNDIPRDPYAMGQEAANNDESWTVCPFIGGAKRLERELWLAGYHQIPRLTEDIC